ncbi:aldo/keto reductase [Dyadobacter sandarakinus]|uniref:Aldo/keto reductase n=1 Tax=Dyadobacter sandarakinus TaxID=2747268 RepID=A0ABX7I411_9BACT|nr:aldo/keto reductase [Dyadobacter sandarakinus]QRR00569.1 aldo/keto reductase [Dyadobacter sandarakinus]
MEKTALGKTDLRIAPINLGGNVFGWTLNEQQSFGILDGFAGAGFNFIDTADTYSHWAEGNKGGESETIIGNWMQARGNRDRIVVATKVGSATSNLPKNVSKEHILKTAEESLKRLKTDYIDLYYTHFDDEVTPLEETLGAYQQLIEQGKVRYIAASNVSPARLTGSLELAEKEGLPIYKALQPHYNLVEREGYERDYAPVAEKYGLAVLPYWSLASGFLTGKYRSESDLGKSPRGQGVKQYLNDRGLAVLGALDQVASGHGSSPATVALAWLLHQPLIAAPIVSATSDTQLQTLIEAPGLKLTAEDLELLNQASA